MNPWVEQVLSVLPGQKIHCSGVIPKDLEVFKDHFPDFPVLPGVLALDILRESVDLCIASDRPNKNGAQRLLSVKAVKFQHFLRPGEAWDSQAEYSSGASSGSWNVKLTVQGRTAVSAHMLFSSMHNLVTEE